MSDNSIIVIPETADYVPSSEARRQAVELFRRLAPKADEVTEEASETIRFIDCGSNFERTLCPACGAAIALEWWDERMDEEMAAGFPLRSHTVPCCHTPHTLDQLTYDWPQGFARFSVEAMNPGIPNLTDGQLKEFESILGCRVRQVLRHL